ncbi:MAG: hypothetical protein ABR588_00075 [Sphingomicrobium sp.]|nr:hypothetical protein [Sphingomonadales bacterium]
MSDQQRDYHVQRAREEIARAAAAASGGAERSHRELAQLHSDKARAPDGDASVFAAPIDKSAPSLRVVAG